MKGHGIIMAHSFAILITNITTIRFLDIGGVLECLLYQNWAIEEWQPLNQFR